jgi:hypothetical protein
MSIRCKMKPTKCPIAATTYRQKVELIARIEETVRTDHREIHEARYLVLFTIKVTLNTAFMKTFVGF